MISFIINVTDVDVEDQRDRELTRMAAAARGKRCQPPMVDRLRAVVIYVEHLEAQGIPFGTARNSRMNKAVLSWINKRTKATSDPRKSRRKQLSPGGVQALLKQVAELR